MALPTIGDYYTLTPVSRGQAAERVNRRTSRQEPLAAISPRLPSGGARKPPATLLQHIGGTVRTVALFEAEQYPAVHTRQVSLSDQGLVPLLPSKRGGPVGRPAGPNGALPVSGRQVLHHAHRGP